MGLSASIEFFNFFWLEVYEVLWHVSLLCRNHGVGVALAWSGMARHLDGPWFMAQGWVDVDDGDGRKMG